MPLELEAILSCLHRSSPLFAVTLEVVNSTVFEGFLLQARSRHGNGTVTRNVFIDFYYYKCYHSVCVE